jgi:hypothetical protein
MVYNKRKRKKHKDEVIKLRNIIKDNNNKIWLPQNINFEEKNTNSWYNKLLFTGNHEYKPIVSDAQIPKISDKKGRMYKAKQINMYPNSKQKKILLIWIDAFRKMYNKTITYIKQNLKNDDLKLLKELSTKSKSIYVILTNYYKQLKTQKNELTKLHKKLNKLYKNKKVTNHPEEPILTKSQKKAQKKAEDLETKRIDAINDTVNKIISTKNNIKALNIIINKTENERNIVEKRKSTIYKKIYDLLYNYKYIRTYILKDERDTLIENTITKNNDISVQTHIMDAAIKKACASYKTCTENYLEGHIKKFRIKYWKENKESQMMEIEKGYINKNQICGKKLGNIKYTYDNENFILPKETISVHYNSTLNSSQYVFRKELKRMILKMREL